MARGSIAEVPGQSAAADSQLGQTNAIAGEENQRAKKLENQLLPGYTSLMNTGYLSPEEETAATTNEMGAATQPFQSMEFKAGNRAGATRNASDLTAQQDQLALEEGQTAGTQASQLQKEKMAGQEAGMYGIHGLEAGDQQAMESMYGLGPGTLNARTSGSHYEANPWDSALMAGIGAGGAVGAGFAGKPA